MPALPGHLRSRYHEHTLTHNDENVPGSAAKLAAVHEIMQAGMPALPGHFRSRFLSIQRDYHGEYEDPYYSGSWIRRYRNA